MPEAGNWGNPTPGVGVGWWECSGLCSLSTPQLGLGHRDPALKVQRMLMAAGSWWWHLLARVLGEQVIFSWTHSPEPCEFTSLSFHLKALIGNVREIRVKGVAGLQR